MKLSNSKEQIMKQLELIKKTDTLTKVPYSKEEQLKNNREKKKSMFGKKSYAWSNNTKSKKVKEKKNDKIDSDYSKWLGTQPCVITGIRAERGAGANNIHCHHIFGRSLGRNDYKQVPLIGYVHSWGEKSYHSSAKSDFIKHHKLMCENIIDFFEEVANDYVNKYIEEGNIIH